MDEGRIIALDTVKNLIGMLTGVIHVGLRQVDEALLAQLSALPAVRQATIAPQPAPPPPAEGKEAALAEPAPAPSFTIVKLETEDSQQGLLGLIAFLNERDLPIASLEILEPNPENVFPHLTGKRLREWRSTEAQMGGLSSVVLWIMAALGGSFFPSFLMKGVLGTVSKVVPHFAQGRPLW